VAAEEWQLRSGSCARAKSEAGLGDYSDRSVRGAIDEINAEIDPTFTIPEVFDPSGTVREILAVQPFGFVSTVVVVYSLVFDLSEAAWDMARDLSGGNNREVNRWFQCTLASNLSHLGRQPDFAAPC
jgi:hypothetical protein